MSDNDDPMDGYKLLLVPMRDIRALSRGIPQEAVLGVGAAFEVIADVAADRKIRMSRRLYEQVEVAEA